MAKDEQNQSLRRFSGMVIFILIATLLWLIIKLSDTYTVTSPFAIHFVEVPADHLVMNDSKVSATMTTTGFKLLNYYFKTKSNRKIEISLKEVKYRKFDTNRYSINGRFVEEKIAEFMSTNPNDVKLTDENVYFSMSTLASKRVKIVPKTNITFEKQYNFYGEPVATPDSITVYGSADNINNINEVHTETINRKNVHQNISTSAKIDLAEGFYADFDHVDISICVEKFTEAEVVVPIGIPENLKLHLYPNKASIRYIVAMKDYAIINSLSFKAEIDTTNMFFNDFLPVKLVLYPNNTQIIKVDPKEVEYIIIQ